uniref:Uncharacterized protein n=1 Tax=Anguilla anguilla TaxID=7936 RepID=A0A0E9Q4M5_ANGAN
MCNDWDPQLLDVYYFIFISCFVNVLVHFFQLISMMFILSSL